MRRVATMILLAFTAQADANALASLPRRLPLSRTLGHPVLHASKPLASQGLPAFPRNTLAAAEEPDKPVFGPGEPGQTWQTTGSSRRAVVGALLTTVASQTLVSTKAYADLAPVDEWQGRFEKALKKLPFDKTGGWETELGAQYRESVRGTTAALPEEPGVQYAKVRDESVPYTGQSLQTLGGKSPRTPLLFALKEGGKQLKNAIRGESEEAPPPTESESSLAPSNLSAHELHSNSVVYFAASLVALVSFILWLVIFRRVCIRKEPLLYHM